MNYHCPVCYSESATIIGKPKINAIASKFITQKHNVVQCEKCGTYYVYPPISFSKAEWSALYNSEYFASQTTWLIKKRAKELTERFDKAMSFLKKNDVSFLDIGAGEGKTLIEGSKRNWNVTGIDIVDNRIQDAKKDTISFIKGYFLELYLQADSYDFIYLDSVLEHVPEPIKYLKKVKKLLKKEGIAYIAVPNEDCLFKDIKNIVFSLTDKGKYSPKIKPFDSPYHIIGFNPSSLSYSIHSANLEILEENNIGRKFDFLSHKPNQRGFWIGLFFLMPIEFIGKLFKKDVYLEAYIKK